jgi:hypothetical protein
MWSCRVRYGAYLEYQTQIWYLPAEPEAGMVPTWSSRGRTGTNLEYLRYVRYIPEVPEVDLITTLSTSVRGIHIE